MAGKKRDAAKRFWAKVDVRGEDECWNWTKALNEHGYGWFSFNGSPDRASRVSWIFQNGPIPAGKCVLHKCDNPKCVNPKHLFLGTHKDNTQDMIKKRRTVFGEKASWAKITEEEARRIREDNRPQSIVAQEYGLCQQSISLIKRRINWSYLE